jgi:type II secretion system protein I
MVFNCSKELFSPLGNRGLTLLEVLVAVAILGSVLVVLFGAVNRNLIMASQSKNLTIAETLAQKKLSEIELEGYPELGVEEGEFEEFPGFRWKQSVREFDVPILESELRLVLLQIIWDEGRENFEVSLAMSQN